MATYNLNINGEQKTVNVDTDTPLLWVLRDTLNLVGTKYGCGIAQCGACTIHLDGNPMRSCVLPVSSIGEQKITTIEGLSGRVPEALKDAWKEKDVPQCGYCQAGQIMTAAALLKEKRRPSSEEVENAMNGNLCRCATYNRIKDAILSASKNI